MSLLWKTRAWIFSVNFRLIKIENFYLVRCFCFLFCFRLQFSYRSINFASLYLRRGGWEWRWREEKFSNSNGKEAKQKHNRRKDEAAEGVDTRCAAAVWDISWISFWLDFLWQRWSWWNVKLNFSTHTHTFFASSLFPLINYWISLHDGRWSSESWRWARSRIVINTQTINYRPSWQQPSMETVSSSITVFIVSLSSRFHL